MNTSRIILFLTAVSVSTSCFALNELPPLRWKKPIEEITMKAEFVCDLSDERFFCVKGNRAVIIEKSDGTVEREILFDGDIADIRESNNGGYLVAKEDSIALLDQDLKTLWAKEVIRNLNIREVIETKDGGYAALSFSNDTATIIRIGESGEVIWSRELTRFTTQIDSFPRNVYLNDVVGISEVGDGFILGGNCFIEQSIMIETGYYTKYTYAGEREWIRLAPGISFKDWIYDGNVISVVGRKDNNAEPLKENQEMAKKLYFPTYSLEFLQIAGDGSVTEEWDFSAEYGNTIRKADSIYIISGCSLAERISQNGMDSWKVMGVNEAGEHIWSHVKYLESASGIGYDYTMAQPLTGGLIVFADSAYYYEHTTNILEPSVYEVTPSHYKISVLRNHISINTKINNSVAVSLYSVDGQQVLKYSSGSSRATKHTVSLHGVAAGVYFMDIRGGKQVNSRKITISR